VELASPRWRVFSFLGAISVQDSFGPLFGMSKAEMVAFSIEMGCGTSVRAIPHTTLTASDQANYESIMRGETPGPVPSHDHYDEESDANTDLENEFGDGYRVFGAGIEDNAYADEEEDLVGE
jgi:hypothetical protein